MIGADLSMSNDGEDAFRSPLRIGQNPDVWCIAVFLADLFGISLPSRRIDGARQYQARRSHRAGEVRQVGVFEPVGNEVGERVRIVLCLGNAPKRAQAPREVNDIDGLIERGRALGRNGRGGSCRDHEAPTSQVGPGAQAADHGQQVGDALAEKRLAQD